MLLLRWFVWCEIPVLGKHTKTITCGAWNSENYLAMGGNDLTMTVTNGIDGEALKTLNLKMEPHEIHFNKRKLTDNQDLSETTISINVGQRSVYLLSVSP